jgi:hypothetical protein
MAFMLRNLPEDIIFFGIQEFLGKEKIIYFNKYTKEYRVKFCKNYELYNKLNELFENISIIYNKDGGSVLELKCLDTGILDKQNKFAITHIVYNYKNIMVVNTELCKRVEHYDDSFDDIDDWIFRDVPSYVTYKSWFQHSTNYKK